MSDVELFKWKKEKLETQSFGPPGTKKRRNSGF